MIAPQLVDAYGRYVTDIRISVTNRCNFNCVYCHNEGQGKVRPAGLGPDGELTGAEFGRIVRIAHEFGIRQVKLTGGEPLVRADLEELIASIPDGIEVSMTTNGSLLEARAATLHQAGLDRVNVSVDTMDPHHFAKLTHGSVAPVLRGVAAAIKAGLQPIKLNMVVFKPTIEFVRSMIDHVSTHDGLELQLIQFMPEHVGMRDQMVEMKEVRDWLEAKADRVEIREMHHRRKYFFNGTRVEVVDPVGNPEFCENCHRIRVTYDAKLKGCLNRNDNLISLRGLGDDGVRGAFRQVVAQRVPYYGVYVPLDTAGRAPASSAQVARAHLNELGVRSPVA